MTAASIGQPAAAAAAPPRQSSRRNFGVNLAGNVGYAAAQYGLLIVLARLGSAEMVGQYSLALALAAPVFMFTNARLAVLLASDAGRERSFAQYLSARVAATTAGVAVVLAAGVVAGYRGVVLATLAFVAAAKAFESVSDLSYGYIAFREAFTRQTVSLLARGIGAVAAAAAAAIITRDLVWISAAIAVVWLVAVVVLDLPALASLAASDPVPARAPARTVGSMLRHVHVDRGTLRLVWQSAPLGFVALAASLTVSLPRIVVERELGASALGYFAALAYLVVAGRMVAIALGSAAVPRLGRYFASRDRTAFIRALLGLVAFGASLGAVGVLGAVALGEPVLGLVYGADYTRYTSLLTWLMVAAGFGYVSIYLQDALTTMRSLAPKALLLAGVAATSGFLAHWLVPRWGLDGAAIAACGAAAIEALGSALLVAVAMRRAFRTTVEIEGVARAADAAAG